VNYWGATTKGRNIKRAGGKGKKSLGACKPQKNSVHPEEDFGDATAGRIAIENDARSNGRYRGDGLGRKWLKEAIGRDGEKILGQGLELRQVVTVGHRVIRIRMERAKRHSGGTRRRPQKTKKKRKKEESGRVHNSNRAGKSIRPLKEE